MLWIFQIVLLSATYQDMKVNQVRVVADKVQVGIIQDNFTMSIQIEAVKKNVCGLVYNSKSVLLYQVDSLGLGCVLNEKALASPTKITEYIDVLKNSSNGEMIVKLRNEVIDQNMLLYGREVNSDFGNYYIFLNTPLDPIDSTISIITNQFVYVTFFVFLLATVLAFYIARRLSSPIVLMKKSAMSLAKGNYDVHFESSEFEEITELANTLNHTGQELKKMDELRRDLIANVSHDIKTPLTMIKAYAEMIRDLTGNNKEKREENLEVILDEVDHLDALVKDMTQLSQLQSNVLSMNRSDFDLVALTNHVLKLMDALIISNSIEVDFLTPEKVMVNGDKIKIQQVIFNFISNAIKFIGEDHKLIIQILLEDEFIRFEVTDHGVGIKEEDLPHIWDRYYKIDKHHARNIGGTGLGLSIANAILKGHGIDFGVISEVKQGSTFWFNLPFSKKTKSHD
ncbi:MAG: HAMP domain-containing histidine kinase [Erysipelotrichaceae bacterium]|nr:HAMP domain-containing histidine kinase [Erysipelotrichaceae bacterium]